MIIPLLSSSLSKRFKATSAVTLSLAVMVSIFGSQPSIAQAMPTKNVATELTAASTKAFTPPGNQRRRGGYSTTTGTRQAGCVGDEATAFTALGPSEMVGQTTSNRPEFAWYLPPSETAYPVQFRLLALDDQDIPVPIHTAELDYAGGFMTYQLPAEVAALAPETEYRWQVIVVCDANYLSRSLNQELSFEVMAFSAELQQSLPSATTNAERALAYGEAGFWYDAIAQVAQSTDPESKAVLQSLLEDLAKTEADNNNAQLSADLLNIAAAIH